MALEVNSDKKTVTIEVLRPFRYKQNADTDTKVVKAGSKLEVKASFAAEMIAAGKATDQIKGSVKVESK